MAGLGPTGFVQKRLTQIVADLEAAARAAWGSGTVTKPDGVIGQIIGLAATPIAELWALAQSVWASFSPSTAEGVELDAVVELNNLVRLAADETEFWGRYDGTDGTTVAVGSGARHPETDDLYAPPAAVTIDDAACLRVDRTISANDAGMWTVTIDGVVYSVAGAGSAAVTADVLAIAINQTIGPLVIGAISTAARRFTLTAAGGDQTARFPVGSGVRIFNDPLNNGIYTVVSSTFDAAAGQTSIIVGEDIPSGVAAGNIRKGLTASTFAVVDVDDNDTPPVAGTVRIKVYFPASATDASEYQIAVVFAAAPGAGAWAYASVGSAGLTRADEAGPKQINADVTLNLVTGQTGWTGLVSVMAGDTGRDQETDAELRVRRLASLQQGGGTVDAIRAAILAVEGVDAVRVYENDTDVVDADGRPAHSVHAVVEGGRPADIAQAVFEQKAAGIYPHGSVLVDVTDSQGIVHTMRFDRVGVLREFVVVHARGSYAEETIPDNAEDLIADAVEAAGNALQIGQDVIAQRFFGAVFDAADGLTDVTVLVRRAGLTAFNLDETDATNEYLYLIAALGDLTATFPAGTRISVRGTTTSGVDGVYTVASSLFTGGRTRITVEENVPTTIAIGASGAIYVVLATATDRDLNQSSAATNQLWLAAAEGDLTNTFVPGARFTVEGNTVGLDGCYTVSASALDAGRTRITTVEDIVVTMGAGNNGAVFVALEIDPVDPDERATFDDSDVVVVVP